MGAPLEIERKYLIRMPDTAALSEMPDARVFAITQTYLLAPKGISRRVRKRTEGDKTVCILTEKRRISALTAIEEEREISSAEYASATADADPAATPIEKVRYAVPHGKYTLEIDIYPFWDDAAILEIELSSEDEEPPIPPFLSVLCEVTKDGRFKNAALARNIAERAILPHLVCPSVFEKMHKKTR